MFNKTINTHSRDPAARVRHRTGLRAVVVTIAPEVSVVIPAKIALVVIGYPTARELGENVLSF